jgi:hypothetical protein
MRVTTRIATALALLTLVGLLSSCGSSGPQQSANSPGMAAKIDAFANKDKGGQGPGGMDYINSQRQAPK